MGKSEHQINTEETRIFLSSLNSFLKKFDIEHRGLNKFNLSETDADNLLIGFADSRAVLEDLEEELEEHPTDELKALRSQTKKSFEKLRNRLVKALVRSVG